METLVNMSIDPGQSSSSELVELHIFYVPEGSWNYKLNTVSMNVINKFISAGFIRISPDLTLQALRERLVEFLGEDAIAEKFLFLKCIGNNLAVVKTKQESELKLKSFAPPHALQPELYLLPIVDHLGNVFSASTTVSLDDQQLNNNVAEDDGIIQEPFNLILSNEEPGTEPSLLESIVKELLHENWEEEESAEGKDNSKENKAGENQSENSELLGSLEDSKDENDSNENSASFLKNEDDRLCVIREDKEDNQISKQECVVLPDVTDFPSLPSVHISIPGDNSLSQSSRENIIEQINQLKEERLQLERIKEELIKKVEKLFEQSTLKQLLDSDDWKKKYFETKKVTASLEEIVTKLREDLELFYKKLLMQLEAREIKMRPKNLANTTDSKNYFIIKITELQHAIDQLKRKLDTDKMKLIIETKMRKQGVSNLRNLKAELAQKTNTLS
ncbi:spermatogenesis-associated protein 1 [Sorex araneus]|uniref:spermatogenesis-associated protein 1 n=1 Tax=Sorex araneus TaxID=42254 RepID=UPI002433F8D8|nr:spermatogenesis-associated protein 1 [Sorex araneus]XP_054994525.1 spermatogenesis-associated protein 1 [Sorex araneus]